LRNKTKSEDEITSDVGKGKIDLDEEVKNYEMELIRCALIRTGGRQRKAARLLNIKISTLNAKIKRYNIDWSGAV
jgi:DNA-binding NtrC family response regulator